MKLQKKLNEPVLIPRQILRKKAQLFSIDLVISLVLFTVVFIFVLALWNLYSLRLQEKSEFDELQFTALQITDLLLRTPGYPENWLANPTEVAVLGLAKSDYTIDPLKLSTFLNLEYNFTKKVLNIERWDYQFRMRTKYGVVAAEKGNPPPVSAQRVVSINRFALIGNETRQVQLLLWKK